MDKNNKNTVRFFLPENNRTRFNHYSFTFYQGLSQQINLNYADDKFIASADVILICVKAYQVEQAVADISKLMNKEALLVMCHNGMGTLQALPFDVINTHTILSLLTTHGCLQNNLLHATHTGLGVSEIGLISGKLSSNFHLQVTETLNTILPNVYWQQDIVEPQWRKLAINCVINPLTALDNVSNGEITDEKYRLVIHDILVEVVNVAHSLDIILSINELKEKVLKVASATSQNSSSMRCDVLANKMTEVDYINGFIHRAGIEQAIDTPTNTQLWQKVKALSTQ
jgi:2-dehydropantoate 2-reductase